jgi:hypothetical protein
MNRASHAPVEREQDKKIAEFKAMKSRLPSVAIRLAIGLLATAALLLGTTPSLATKEGTFQKGLTR